MFYSSQLLSRKTALGICWLASHLEGKRLKRTQVFEVSITASCDSILNPEAPLALRLSGQLLLGVVRIYQRKLLYLETDARNAIDGLQRKEGNAQNVDLPDGGTAPETTITLPDADATAMFGGEMFPRFHVDLPGLEPSEAVEGGFVNSFLRTGDSLTAAGDMSDVFGSRWTVSERLEVAGDDLDRRFSAELERLRSQAAVENPGQGGQLFYDAPDDGGYGSDGNGGDHDMMPVPSDLFTMAAPVSVGRTPGSAAGLPGAGPSVFTPPSLGVDALPDLGFEDAGQGSGDRWQGDTPGAAGQRLQRRRKRVQLDVDAEGRPATQLPNDDIRQMLADRAPLLKQRGLTAADLQQVEPAAKLYDVMTQSEAARDSFLYRPACFDRLAPELLAVFNRALGVDPDGKAPGGGRRRRKRAEPDNAADLAGVDDAANPFAADPSPAPSGVSLGANDEPGDYFGGEMDPLSDNDDYPVLDAIETSQPGGDATQPGDLPGGADNMSPGSKRMMPLPLMSAAPSGTLLVEEASGPDDDEDGNAQGRDGFTQRTKVVLQHLQQRLAPAPGDKRRHPQSAAGDARSVTLDGIVQGRSRLEACRWFFEALVLKNKGYIDLHQDQPYGEISVTVRERGQVGQASPGSVGAAVAAAPPS